MMNTRKYWLDTMLKIASPVIEALAEGRLAKDMPIDREDRRSVTYLEAFGRTLEGIAPWLESELPEGEEKKLQAKYRELTVRAMDLATNPASPDFLNFTEGKQPLVDAAFMAHGILRAKSVLWQNLPDRVKANVKAALISSRRIEPYNNNWLLFASMVEATLYYMGEEPDRERLGRGIRSFRDKWYVGDGIYGDGSQYHQDYYNSFVIQPMLIDILNTVKDYDGEYAEFLPLAEARAQRYAEILERMIMPDGSYPIVGRSICYRFGCFQMLAQSALQKKLAENITPAMVRCALTSVIRRVMETKSPFDKDGWLIAGVVGHQPELAERYISTGSLYLCCAVFLPLGLAPSDPFWADADELPTNAKAWSGEHISIDHAYADKTLY